MAASQRPEARTASVCTAETARGTHSFKIAGYSLHKGLGVGKFIASASFAVGGHEWRIRYYPDGAKEDTKDYVAVFLELVNNPVQQGQVRVRYDFWLVNPATGLSSSVLKSTLTVYDGANICWGNNKWKKRSELEASYLRLRNDCLEIECDVSVIKESRPEETERHLAVQVPPSDLSKNLGKFLESGEGSDVTFNVKGEVFHAHKFMLAARSSVFKAEFYGPMMDKDTMKSSIIITVEDMEPDVFKALLHFIYKDSLPAMDDLDGGEDMEIVKHLLVAADRYAVERMKLICESILCKGLQVDSVAATLALADQHHCSKLRDACAAFITSPDRIDDVVASKEYYNHLKRVCPDVFMDVWEKAAKSRKS